MSRSSVMSWKTMPIDSRTFWGSFVTSYPATVALPFCRESRVIRTLIAVLLPAPFGPRKLKISPFFTEKLMLSTALNLP